MNKISNQHVLNTNSGKWSWLKLGLLIICLANLSGCGARESSIAAKLNPSETVTRGHYIDNQTLGLIPAGTSKEQVLLLLGSPSLEGPYGDKALYYYSEKWYRAAKFLKARPIERRVVAIYLNANDRVSKVADYGLKNGRVFDFISRATPTAGQEEGFLGSLFSVKNKKLRPMLP